MCTPPLNAFGVRGGQADAALGWAEDANAAGQAKSQAWPGGSTEGYQWQLRHALQQHRQLSQPDVQHTPGLAVMARSSWSTISSPPKPIQKSAHQKRTWAGGDGTFQLVQAARLQRNAHRLLKLAVLRRQTFKAATRVSWLVAQRATTDAHRLLKLAALHSDTSSEEQQESAGWLHGGQGQMPTACSNRPPCKQQQCSITLTEAGMRRLRCRATERKQQRVHEVRQRWKR